jgi:hypothetical protein
MIYPWVSFIHPNTPMEQAMNTGSLFQMMRKTQEAYCVRHGIPVDRQFSDDELADSQRTLTEVERELYGMTDDERMGRLGPEEQALLDELNGKNLITFRVTVTVPGRMPDQINVLAPHACNAVTMALELMFPEFDSVKPTGGIQIKAEAISAKSRRAA